jgi:putative heme transporter
LSKHEGLVTTTNRVEDAPGAELSPVPEAPGATKRKPKSLLRRRMTRTIQVIAFFFIIQYLVIPRIAGLQSDLARLRHVNVFLLILGVGLEIAAFWAYAKLTQAALNPSHISTATLFRIQLATKSVTNVVPGGSAAGSALGYRLLSLSGVEPGGAGFALATAGLGSAVVLNLLLWATLLISIPISGVNPVYVTVALAGVIVIGAFGVVVIFLVRGAERADRIVQSLARRFSFVDPGVVSSVIRRLGARIRLLAADRGTLLRLVGWAVLNWTLDAASLWVFLRAFGESVRPDSLVVAFCVANVLAAIPLTPGGLGVIDVTLTTMLTFFGVPAKANALGVQSYRLAAYWFTIPAGALAFLSLRVGPWRVDKKSSLRSLRDEAGGVVETGETVYDWIDRAISDAEADGFGGAVTIRAPKVGTSTVHTPVTPPAAAPSAAPVVPPDHLD